MTHWRKIHQRKNVDLLFAEDLGGFGCKPVDVEVVDSGVRKVSDGDSSKEMPWIAFAGPDGKRKTKVLALNVTNSKIMQTLTGTGEVERWRGWITLIVVRTKYQDRLTGQRMETDAIRIAPERPRPPAKNQRGKDAPPKDEPKASEPPPSSEPPASSDDDLTDDEKRELERMEASANG